MKVFLQKWKGVILAFTGGVLAHKGLAEYNNIIEVVLNAASQ